MAKKDHQSKYQQPPDETPLPDQQSPDGETKLVKMVRSAEDAKGGPTSADVHHSEVEAWKAAGWKTK